MVRKGRDKPNVAGERYDTNAIPLGQPAPAQSRTRPHPGAFNPADLMGMLGGGGGMPDMSQMMEMMQGMGGGMPGMAGMMPGMAGGMPGMAGGMPGMMPGMPGMAGMMPPMEPARPKIIYVYGLAEGAPTASLMTFYPNYIDSKKTVQQGRRIPQAQAQACESPLADEMSEVCTYLKLPHVLEPAKKYPRDWLVAGRVRVRLVRADGSPENPEVPTRKALMVKMAELIPKLQSRKLRLEREAEEAKKKAAAAAGAVTATSTGGKKKGKKKGRR